jgi:putative ABC transport system permease protein
MNVMLIAISQRRAEVGLLKAVGARGGDIMVLFLGEALVLSLVGAGLGLLTGAAGLALIGMFFPALPLTVPGWSLGAAVAVALVTGLLFGILPAVRASRLDPVAALARR